MQYRQLGFESQVVLIAGAALDWYRKMKELNLTPLSASSDPLQLSALQKYAFELDYWLAQYDKQYESAKTPTDEHLICEQAVSTLKNMCQNLNGIPSDCEITFKLKLQFWRLQLASSQAIISQEWKKTGSNRSSISSTSTTVTPRDSRDSWISSLDSSLRSSYPGSNTSSPSPSPTRRALLFFSNTFSRAQKLTQEYVEPDDWALPSRRQSITERIFSRRNHTEKPCALPRRVSLSFGDSTSGDDSDLEEFPALEPEMKRAYIIPDDSQITKKTMENAKPPSQRVKREMSGESISFFPKMRTANAPPKKAAPTPCCTIS